MKITVKAKHLINALQEFNYKAFNTYNVPDTEQTLDIIITSEDSNMPQMCAYISFETDINTETSFRFRGAETAKCRLDVFSAQEAYEPIITSTESSRIKIRGS
jgi:hypothetical protein